jgi:hypothetical protein
MTASECNQSGTCDASDDLALGEEVVELTLLVLRSHYWALGGVAKEKGVTVAWLLRQMIRDYLACETGSVRKPTASRENG